MPVVQQAPYPEFTCKLNIEDLIRRTSVVCKRLKVAVSSQITILEAVLETCQIHLEPRLTKATVAKIKKEAVAADAICAGLKTEISEVKADDQPSKYVEQDVIKPDDDLLDPDIDIDVQHLDPATQDDVDTDPCPPDPLSDPPNLDVENVDSVPNLEEVKTELKLDINVGLEGKNMKEKLKQKRVYSEQKLMCDQCDYTGVRKNLWAHNKFHHEEKKFACELCDYVAPLPNVLTKHKATMHADPNFLCDQCEYKTALQTKLKQHKKTVHENERYACNQCEMVFRSKVSVRKHKENKHEGVRYPCDECDYKATKKQHLKMHQAARHQGVKYPCDQCEFAAAQKDSLERHKELKHLGIKFSCDQCPYVGSRKALGLHKNAKHKKLIEVDRAKLVIRQID